MIVLDLLGKKKSSRDSTFNLNYLQTHGKHVEFRRM